jgi:hypothetical protein
MKKLHLALAALLIIFLAGCALHYARGTYFFTPGRDFQYAGVDDAYITFRYGWNLAQFGTLSWNESGFRRTEGFTNPLWVLLSAAWALAKQKDWLYPGVTATSVLLTGSLLFFLGKIINRKTRSSAGLAGVLLVAASPVFWLHTTSGLESGLFGAVIGILAYLGVFNDEENPTPAWLFRLFAFTAVLLRSDGFVYLLVLTIALLVVKNRAWKAISFGGASGLILLFGWRLWSFGQIFPNTAAAKLNFGLADRIIPGLLALLQTLPGILILLLVGCFGLLKLPRQKQIPSVLILAGWVAYYVYIGGDFFVERHLLGVMVFSAGLSAAFFEQISQEKPWKFALATLVLAAALFMPLSYDMRFSYFKEKHPDAWILLGKEIAKDREKYGIIVTFPAGKIPFFAGGDFIDELGLNDPYLATLKRDHFIPGHAAGSHAEAVQIARASGKTYTTFAFSFMLTPENIDDLLLWVNNISPENGVQHEPTAAQKQILLSNRNSFEYTLIFQGEK